MGSTCASVHILWRGSVGDAAKAISRAYTKLGYERAKKAPPAGGKHVILLARDGERYISIYDSTNADLDSGELKDAALASSRLLKTGTVFTSLYDSDSYEFVVFSNGRQIDLLMSDVESYSGPLKRLSDKARVTQWNKVFGKALTTEQIEDAATERTAFANSTITNLCGLIGLPGDRPQMHYVDFADEPDSIAAALYFTRKAAARPAPLAGQISLRNYFDPDNSRKLLVYPASWPMPVGNEELLTWLMLSEGAGFSRGTATVEVIGPDGLAFSKGFMNGAKFHNGQIVGGYELPKDATVEVARAYLETKRFVLTPDAQQSSESRSYTAEYPNLMVPSMTPDRTTQILVVLQLGLSASIAGEWEVKVTLRPGSQNGYSYDLPAARVAAVESTWMPVVSGLNPKTSYDTADLLEERLPDHLVDLLVRKSGQQHLRQMPSSEARALTQSQQSQQRERQHKVWLQDIEYKQKSIQSERGLDHPAIAANVAILRDGGQATLDVCRSYLEGWLRPLLGKTGEARIRAERHMTEAFHVGKLKKSWPIASIVDDKAWGKFFEYGNEYQTVIVDFVEAGGEFPVAGMGLSYSLRDRKIASRDPDPDWNEYNERVMALTVGKMRGRKFDGVKQGHTLHVFSWTIAHERCFQYLETSADDMKATLDAFAAKCSPIQAWHAHSTWIPRFDRADGYEATIYEKMSILNFFRGILLEQQCALTERRMTEPWCGNVLRMVAPHMWLCGNLVDQVDKAALERTAVVSEINGSFKILKRQDCAMEDFELALLPILPIESSRLRVIG
jgi:hypothetical protein